MSALMIRTAADWAPYFRTRIAELGLSHFEVDQRTGLAEGYTNKILNGKKLPGALTIERLCRELKISLRPVADGETENSAPKDFVETRQHSDTIDDQRSDLHVEARTGCGPARAGVAGEAAGAGRSGPASARRTDPEDSPRRDRAETNRGRGMNDVLERPQAVPTTPPAPRSKAVLDRMQVCKQELIALQAGIGAATLASAEGEPGASEHLAALHLKIQAAKFEIECGTTARELADGFDREAVTAWHAAVQMLDPDEIVAGIGKDSCCRRCGDGHGCVIPGATGAGRACIHPLRELGRSVFRGADGGLQIGTIEYRNNPQVAKVFKAACKKTGSK